MSKSNPLAQSDEDFLKAPMPSAVDEPSDVNQAAHDAGDPPVDDGEEEEDPAPSNDDGTDPNAEPPAEEEGDDVEADPAPAGEGDEGDPDPANPDDKAEDGDKPEDAKADKSKDDPKAGDPPSGSDDDEPVNQDKQPAGQQRVFQVPTSFQANGKTVELKDETEALKLMQMGANYTRKMQELAPHRKLLLMLQNNNLTDEGKLSFLIDLDQKNPDAIKKLLKDAEIDPLEIDVEGDNEYFAGNHTVTDEEVAFRNVMEEITSDPSGNETVTAVNRDMDEVSKEVIWKQPEILTAIHEHRQTGVYDTIKAEMDRQITLGKLPANTPFLEAYKQVGDQLVAASGVSTAGQQQEEGNDTPKPGVAPKQPATAVATRTAAPKPKVANGDKAGAAASTRSTPAATKAPVNVLAMDDEAFLKSMKDRL